VKYPKTANVVLKILLPFLFICDFETGVSSLLQITAKA
jgi:hypothetical protein